jgi:diguanylate cyclase (GGDEF)-like protein
VSPTRLLTVVALLCAALGHALAADNGELVRLLDRAQAAVRVDPERTRQLAEQALQTLGSGPDADAALADQRLRAHLLLCDHHAERDRAAAERHAAKARLVLPTAARQGLRAMLLTCEGDMHELAGDSAQAAALYEQAVNAAEQARDDEMLGDALYKRGFLRGVRGEFANGLADLRRSHALYERLHMEAHRSTAQAAIATLYNRMGDYAQARHYYEAVLKAQKAAGLQREQAVTQHNLGRVLENLKDWDAAQHAFEAVLAVSREMDYARGEAYGLRGLASVRNGRGNPQEALALLDKASQLQQGAADERLRAQILLQRGIALRLLHRDADAAMALADALEVFRKADSMAEQAMAHGELAAALAARGDWRGAYQHQAQFKQVSDQLLHRQLDERFATLKVEFDSAAKDKENALLQREKAATELALEEQRRAGRLQAVVLALAGVLAAVLAAMVWRHHRTSQRMRQLAMTDELTGLPNRRRVLQRLAELLAQTPPRCALLIADLDHFKAINDEHGHLVGDEVLRAVAQVLRDSAREPMLIGRLGGEEFLVVLPEADLDAAQQVGNRLRAEISALDVSRWMPTRRLTVSLGATAAREGDTAGTMLGRADQALYRAKEGGRDRVVSLEMAA